MWPSHTNYLLITLTRLLISAIYFSQDESQLGFIPCSGKQISSCRRSIRSRAVHYLSVAQLHVFALSEWLTTSPELWTCIASLLTGIDATYYLLETTRRCTSSVKRIPLRIQNGSDFEERGREHSGTSWAAPSRFGRQHQKRMWQILNKNLKRKLRPVEYEHLMVVFTLSIVNGSYLYKQVGKVSTLNWEY
jgi:hypothetical protein